MSTRFLIRGLLLTASALMIAHAGTRRYARVGDMQGAPEVQVHAADNWRPAERNLPLLESSRIQSGQQDRIEVELDDGAVLRLAGNSLAELSDYAQLSTAQRVTLVSLDHGVAYFTGEPRLHDTFSVALPGMQITLRQGSRLRLTSFDGSNTLAVLEGAVMFSTPAMEMQLRAGQFIQIYSNAPDRFTLQRQIPQMEADEWSEGRDKSTAHTTAAAYVSGVGYGLADLDHSGAWVRTPVGELVWKPRVDDNWRPFRDGRWEWYDEAGFTWIPAEAWGWLPYHFGRWMQDASLGWVWYPDIRSTPIYKPGDVYWMRGTGLVAWGPLAPSEAWAGSQRSQLFAPANTTIAPFLAGVRVIDPSKLDEKLAANPAEALLGMAFAVSPISPPLAADRFEALRPELKTADTPAPLVTSAEPQLPQAAYDPGYRSADVSQTQPVPVITAALPAPIQDDPADGAPPLETYIPVPVYTGILVVDPPLWDEHSGRMGNPAAGSTAPGKSTTVSENEPPHHQQPVRLPEPPKPPRDKDNDPKSGTHN
jgi:quercetin dioxygenase-like cupin family protein